jgi:tetratricopeptide (TPR) repeat protein
MARGNFYHARELIDKSFAIAEELNTKPLKALALEHRGRVALFLGEYHQARNIFNERLALASELDDKPAIAKNQLLLAEIALGQSDSVLAYNLAQESMAFFRKQKDNPNVAWSLHILGDACLAQKRISEARKFYSEALLLEEVHAVSSIGRHLLGLAQVFLALGLVEDATFLLGATLSRMNPEIHIHPIQRKDYYDLVEHLQKLLGEPRFTELQQCGKEMKPEDIFDFIVKKPFAE